MVAHGARGVEVVRSARSCARVGQQLGAGAAEAGGEQDDADDRAGEHDQAGGDAGAADERDAGHEQAGDRDQHDAGGGDRGVAGGRVGALGRLDRRTAGAQFLLLARGHQQRVVDAGAEAEHAAQRGGEAGHVGRRGGPHQRAEAEPDAGERGAERVARRAHVAQHGDQEQDGDAEADHLADREPAGGGAVDRLAGHGDLDPVLGRPAVASSSRSRALASRSVAVWS